MARIQWETVPDPVRFQGPGGLDPFLGRSVRTHEMDPTRSASCLLLRITLVSV